MKKALWISVMLAFAVLTFGITRNRPEDRVVLDSVAIETGRQFYTIDLRDANGNYEGNFLRVKFHGDIQDLAIGGVEAWPPDPNFWLVQDVIPSPNDLTGSILIGKTNWAPGHYEFGVQVFDVADHNDCKWVVVDVADTTPPNVFGCRPE
jgi:hypothetical protein